MHFSKDSTIGSPESTNVLSVSLNPAISDLKIKSPNKGIFNIKESIINLPFLVE